MPEIYLTTWNTQGACLSDEGKKQVLINLVKSTKNSFHIFAIQEGGSGESAQTTLGSKHYIAEWSPPYDADNNRCTVGILYPKGIPAETYSIDILGKRPVTICRINDCLNICSIHAIANQAAAKLQIPKVVAQLNKATLPWILAGDMNCPPGILTDVPEWCTILASGAATQKSGHELDYFICHSSVPARIDGLTRVAPSDHDPVTCILSL